MTSWLDIPSDSDFSLQNIPFGVASLGSPSAPHRCVTAIGNYVVDLSVLQDAGAFADIVELEGNVFSEPTLNRYMEHDPEVWPQVRKRLLDLFTGANDLLSSSKPLQDAAFYDQDKATMHLAATIGDYTDFYSSLDHATNVGIMFRGKDNALQPNWLHLPVGYHGRSSTVQLSGEPIVRPSGQLQIDPQDPKKGSTFGACKLLDFELEVAFFVGGKPNQGSLSIADAKKRIFGFCLMNDWSARDIQKWEYVPLGPFTAKNFATTISPWIVQPEALEPYIVPTSVGKQENPTPLEYLQDPEYSSYDIQLTVGIQSPTMSEPGIICKSNFANLYWNAAQQLAHHSVSGCKMVAGDLLASGTISGSTQDSFGSMLELSWKGSRTIDLGNGEQRKFIQDGDTVVVGGFCAKEGLGRIGFGPCSSKVLPVGSSLPTAPKTEQFSDFKLYGYWRSSSSWRVRIALAAKGINYENIPVNLMAGDHKADEFVQKNPSGQLPVLEYTETATGAKKYLTQSVAMIEFLDEFFPSKKSLIPKDSSDKVAASEMMELINSGIQPFQVRKWNNEEGKMTVSDTAKEAIVEGFKALEVLVKRRREESAKHGGPFALGTFAPTIVDACLVPQIFNARRFGVDVDKDFPIFAAIEQSCENHPWFVPAHPSKQPDAKE